jgi:hypothetical protein
MTNTAVLSQKHSAPAPNAQQRHLHFSTIETNHCFDARGAQSIGWLYNSIQNLAIWHTAEPWVT